LKTVARKQAVRGGRDGIRTTTAVAEQTDKVCFYELDSLGKTWSVAKALF
jgi:hypothetical protein